MNSDQLPRHLPTWKGLAVGHSRDWKFLSQMVPWVVENGRAQAHPLRQRDRDPDLDTLRWVFIAVALGEIAVTIQARLDDWHRGQRG